MSVEFKTEIEIKGRIIKVFVEAEGSFVRDLYGADADGNRGDWRTEIEDVELDIRDRRGNDLTNKIYKKYKAQFECIQDEAENRLWDQNETV
jgi:hypothetical protein